MGIVRPVLEVYPYAWAFFVPFIMVTTFAVVNLIVGLVVNSMQDAHLGGKQRSDGRLSRRGAGAAEADRGEAGEVAGPVPKGAFEPAAAML